MKNGNLYSLIPIEDFKAVNGIDDRDDKLSRFCLVTSTLSIEQYCKRRLLRKKIFETVGFNNDLFIPLREYPITKTLAVFVMNNEQRTRNNGELLEPELFSVVPDCGLDLDIPFAISLSPALLRYRRLSAVKVVYYGGYPFGKIPADLGSACLELAAWNFNRYKGKRIGLTGNIKGAGKEGEHFELSMPENVRTLLEPYKRRVI
jgi:hypothetical protein